MGIEISMAAEPLFHIGGLPVTNSIVTTWAVMLFLVILSLGATRKMQLVPSGLQNLAEMVVETLLGMVEPVAGPKLGRRIFPLIASLFIFILTANWIGLLPGFGTIGIREVREGHSILVPILRPANSDFNTTIAMALITIILVQAAGIRAHGVLGYLKELATPWFLTPIHLISEVSHVLSLSARLFGNIFGGDVILMVISSLVPFLAPVVFLVLESLFGLIQALIFSMLSLAYFTIAAGSHQAEH